MSDAMFINLGTRADMLVLSAGPRTYKPQVWPVVFGTERETFQTASSLAEWSVIDGESELGLSMLRLMDAGFYSIGDNDILALLPDELIDDWKTIIVNLINLTSYKDENFRQFLNRHMVSLSEKNRHDEQQAKDAAKRRKASDTKKLRPRGPGDKHIIAGYLKALSENGKPVGVEAREAFYKKVIRYADHEREADFDIELPNNAPPSKWGVKWRTAENRISKLRKAGHIKK
ncbi:hypothetical protein ACFL3I_03265 [Pseudomonadota bacterium]